MSSYSERDFMKIILFLIIAFGCTLKAISAPKDKNSIKSSSKSSIGLKMFTAKIGSGILYGWRHVTYESKGFFIGGTGYTGQMGKDTEVGTFSYGGLVLGYDKSFGKTFSVDYGVTAGGGGGKFTDLSGSTPVTTTGGGIVIEPWLGLDWRVGKTSNMNLGFSQISMPNNENFTGSSVSLRVDFKLQ
jgi:hypothetical protein